MSKKSSKPSSTPAPSAPAPQNAYYYENGTLKSSSVFDKSKDAYVNNAYSTPQEMAIENQANDYMANLVKQIPSAVNLSPDAISGYGEAYAAPQIQALNDSYNKAKGDAGMAASGRGLRNSVGFSNYAANILEKNRAQGLADIASNRKMMELDLPNQLLSPFVNQFNLYNAAATGQQANMAQNYQPAAQGVVDANNIANQNYQNRFASWQAQQPQQPQSRGGLFSFFTGG